MSTWQRGLGQALMRIVFLEIGAVRGGTSWSMAWRREYSPAPHTEQETKSATRHGRKHTKAKAPGCAGARGPQQAR